jgi:hypothetical protein
MSGPEQLPAIAPSCPLDTLALMAAILMAGDLSSGSGCCEPDFYAARALELYLAAQERIEPKLRAQPAQGKPETL